MLDNLPPSPVRVGVVENVEFDSGYVASTEHVAITETLRLVTRTT
jgi:hypothetical protein